LSKHFASILRAASLAVAALALPSDVLAQGKDDLWEVTMKMEMPGMPMAMPAQVNRVCLSKNRKDEDLIPRRENCRVLESSRVGNKLTYKMACTGEEAMTVSGEMTYREIGPPRLRLRRYALPSAPRGSTRTLALRRE